MGMRDEKSVVMCDAENGTEKNALGLLRWCETT